LELEEVQVTPVALERVVDRRVFRPTMRTSKSSSRGEGAVEIDPARLGIEGHVNDLSGSRKAERKGKQRQRVHDENLRRLAWRLASQFHRLVRAYRRKRGHRVCLKRAILRDKKYGATHTKRKRAEFVHCLIKNEIKFRIRIQHNTRVDRHRNGTAPAYNFFLNLPRGEVIQLRGQRVVWGQKLSVTGMRLMSGESLIIFSPDASRGIAILGDDKRRWEIETLFKALKSRGFDFEAIHLTELDRIEKLLALLTIIFCWAHLLGEWLHEQKPIPIKSHHRPATSIFRYGLD